jgi:hypothetical protein
MPCASLALVHPKSHRDSPTGSPVAAEEDVLGFQMTDYPRGLLSSFCVGPMPQCTIGDLGLQDDTWAAEIKAQFPEQTRLQESLVHIVGRPRVCGLFGDGTRVCAITMPDDLPTCGLCDRGANLCMTNNPNLLVDVRPCAPFTISLATSDGSQSHMNVCKCRGLLPLLLVNGTTHYQTCFINPYASETFISPQAIIDSSGGSFDKWQMEGYSQGRPGILLMYLPSGLLKMSIELCKRTASTIARRTRSPSTPIPGPDIHHSLDPYSPTSRRMFTSSTTTTTQSTWRTPLSTTP